MPVIVESGYVLKQDYLRPFFSSEKDYSIFTISYDLRLWWFHLPPVERRQTPLPSLYPIDDVEHSVFWVGTRRFVRRDDEVDGIGRLKELDADIMRKKTFAAAFGKDRDFDENQMEFRIIPAI